MSYWRDKAAPIVRQVLAETAGQSEAAIKTALRAAYPFGERKYHPYKTWLDEIKRQRGKKPPLGTQDQQVDPRQLALGVP